MATSTPLTLHEVHLDDEAYIFVCYVLLALLNKAVGNDATSEFWSSEVALRMANRELFARIVSQITAQFTPRGSAR